MTTIVLNSKSKHLIFSLLLLLLTTVIAAANNQADVDLKCLVEEVYDSLEKNLSLNTTIEILCKNNHPQYLVKLFARCIESFMNKDFTKAEIIEIILHNKEAEKFYKYKNSQIKSKRNKALLKKFLIVGIVILFFFITFKWLKSNKNVTEKFSIFPTNSDSQGNSKVSQSKAENSINQFLTRTENTPLAPSPSTLTQLLQPTTFQVHASNNVTHTTQAPINNAEAEWPTSFISETRYNQQLSDSLEQLLENSHLHADLRAVAIEPCRNGLPIDRLTKNGNSFLNMLEYELEMGMVIGIEPRANWV